MNTKVTIRFTDRTPVPDELETVYLGGKVTKGVLRKVDMDFRSNAALATAKN